MPLKVSILILLDNALKAAVLLAGQTKGFSVSILILLDNALKAGGWLSISVSNDKFQS